jgi:hypothetical protein
MKLLYRIGLLGLFVLGFSLSGRGQVVTRAEYFFNTDPGVGNGKSLPVTAGGQVEVTTEVGLEGLANGFHTLYVRVRDQQGRWSLSEGRPLLIQQSPLVPAAAPVARAEYFFNTDPGVGKGTTLPVTTTAGQASVAAEVGLEGLTAGFQTLYVRFQDQQGSWSLSEGRPFLIQSRPAVPVAAPVVAAEYFIDSDPGLGKGTSLPVTTTAGQTGVAAEIATAGLSARFHMLYVRFRDTAGNWSLSESRPFLIDHTTGSLATIVGAEYFFDNANPAHGKGTPLAVVPSPQIALEQQVDVTGLVAGKHRLHLRLRDDKGAWSYTEIKEFTVATPRLNAITPAAGGNIGKVTVSILGASFDEGTSIKLTRTGQPDITVPDSMLAITNGEQIRATLDLEGKAEGAYNVVVTLANGSALTLPNGFRIEKGVEAAPWAEVLGFDRIRTGQWQTYTITYGNKGNVDAIGVPLNIVVGLDTTAQVKLGFDLLHPTAYGADFPYDSIPVFFKTDSLFGERYLAQVYPLLISNIPANSVTSMNIQVKTSGLGAIELLAYTDAPHYNQQTLKLVEPDSPLSGIEVGSIIAAGRNTTSTDFNKNLKKCTEEALDIARDAILKRVFKELPKVVPGVGCFIAGYELTNEIIDHRQGNGEATRSSVLWKWADVIKDCALDAIPGARLWNAGVFVFKTVIDVKKASSCYDVAHKSFGTLRKRIKRVRVVNSFDPNDKIGSTGAGQQNFVYGNTPLRYLIRFENKVSATAAAQRVLIVDTLDTKTLDISTLQLGFFSFDEVIVNIPPGRKNYTADIDLRPSHDLIVRIEAKLDEVKGILTWTYSSLDPLTLQPTANPDAGFLPPNKTAPEGEGGVFYTIKPKANLATNASISNRAYIYFDNNEVIPTPAWVNAIDKTPPTSQVARLAPVQASKDFTVRWSGTDEGAGVSRYTIFVAVNNKPYKPWLRNVTTKSEVFTGKVDSTYHFYSVAVDSAGHVEPTPTLADASTTISTVTSTADKLDKQIAIYPNPAYQTLAVTLPNVLLKSELTLITLHGKVMMQREARETTTTIPVSHLPPGIYMLRIASENAVITRKVMVK